MILATQSVVELADAGVLNIINESCPTKIFLANPNIDRKLYAEVFPAKRYAGLSYSSRLYPSASCY